MGNGPAKINLDLFRQDKNYTILLLGQTGSGKTNLLNWLANIHHLLKEDYSMTHEEFLTVLRSFVRDTISDDSIEHAPDDAMASKTSDAKVYHVKLREVHLTIVDTPGFGDTRRGNQDEVNVQRIMKCLGTVNTVNCVMLVINGRDTRMTATLEYVLAQLVSVMPKAVLDRIAVMFTNTENPRKLLFQRSELTRLGLKVPIWACVENPFGEIRRELQRPEEPDIATLDEFYDYNDKMLASFAQFLAQVQNNEPVLSAHFLELNAQREDIERLLTNIIQKSSEEEHKLESLRKIRDEIMQTGVVEPVTIMQRQWRLQPNMFSWSHYVCHATDCHCNCARSAVLAPLASLWCYFNEMQTCSACGHTYNFHRITASGWECQNVEEIVNLGAIQNVKDVTQRKEVALQELQQGLERSLVVKQVLMDELQGALDEYARLGLPGSYMRLLRMQQCLFKEQLHTNPADENVQDMLRTVERSLNEIERLAEVNCCMCFEARSDTVLNCGHSAFCYPCSLQVGTCPQCRELVTSRTRGTPLAGDASIAAPSS